MRVRCILAAALLILAGASRARAQAPDPKAAFLGALGQFSIALSGEDGDEGGRIWASLEAMDRSLAQWDASIRAYEAAMAADLKTADPPLAARMHLALGGIYLDRGRVQEALSELERARRLDPGRADVNTLIGVASGLAGDAAGATDAFRRASDLDPQDAVRAYMLVRALAGSRVASGAAQALARFLDNVKRRLDGSGRPAAAAPFLTAGLVPERAGVEPFFPPVAYADGFAALERRDYAGAIAQFRRAAAGDPLTGGRIAETEAIGRAASAWRDGDIAGAVQGLQAPAVQGPNRGEAHRLLGRVYASDGRYAAAVKELRSAISLDASDERARLDLGQVLVESDRLPDAAEALHEAIAAFPMSGRARYALARVYRRQGRPDDAIHELEASLALHPLLAVNAIYAGLGALKATQQDLAGAAAAYERRVALVPNEADAHQDLATMYYRQGRDDEAMAEASASLMLNANAAAPWVTLAQVHRRNGRYAEAADAARQALAIDAMQKEARYVLATSLVRLGKTDEGVRELEAFRQLQEETTAAEARQFEIEGLRREAAIASGSGDHEHAVRLLRRVLEAEPDSMQSHLDLAAALSAAGHAAEAIEHFTQAIALGAPYTAHRQLAEAYARAGRGDESRREREAYEAMKRDAIRRDKDIR